MEGGAGDLRRSPHRPGGEAAKRAGTEEKSRRSPEKEPYIV